MAEPTITDVSTALATRWAALGSLAAIIPVASLYLGRTASGTAFPRCRAMIDEGARELTSGTLVLCKFSITLEAYVLDTDATTVGGLIKRLMDWHKGMTGTGWAMPNGSMIHVRPQPGGMTRPTGEQRDGKDVVMVSSRWEALVEGRRELNSF